MLANAQVCSRMLTYAHVCSRMLTYAGADDALGRRAGGRRAAPDLPQVDVLLVYEALR